MKTIIKLSSVVAALALLASAGPAEARGYKGWVPKKAWNAVKAHARVSLSPSAKLFKTSQTKGDSRRLKSPHSRAYVVGAKITPQAGGMPVGQLVWPGPMRTKAYYLVTKDASRQWKVTALEGMDGYKSKVDARNPNARVGVGVSFGMSPQVAHGVKVTNASNLSMVQGKALAYKKTGKYTNMLFVKGVAPAEFHNQAKAMIQGTVRGSQQVKQIPVNFDQVMYIMGQQ